MRIQGKRFIIYCMALLMSCMVFVVGSDTADAMSLSDLQGTYRVVNTNKVGFFSDDGYGLLVKLEMSGDELVGIAQNSVHNFNKGDKVITDVWVDAGTIHCSVLYSWSFGGSHKSIMRVYDNGSKLELVQEGDNPLGWALKRVN